jgi:signal peptidase II
MSHQDLIVIGQTAFSILVLVIVAAVIRRPLAAILTVAPRAWLEKMPWAWGPKLDSRASRTICLLLVLLGATGCDQTTKHFARESLRGRPSVALPAGLGEWVLVRNEGGHLSIGAEWSDSARRMGFIGISSVLLLGLAACLVFNNRPRRFQFLSLALILGGGVGNLIDRVRWGAVTDFIWLQLGPWQTSTFNLADQMILFGFVGFVFSEIFRTLRIKPARIP